MLKLRKDGNRNTRATHHRSNVLNAMVLVRWLPPHLCSRLLAALVCWPCFEDCEGKLLFWSIMRGHRMTDVGSTASGDAIVWTLDSLSVAWKLGTTPKASDWLSRPKATLNLLFQQISKRKKTVWNHPRSQLEIQGRR